MSDTTDFCPKCGTNLEPADTACPSCGTAVHGAPAAPAPQGLDAIVNTAKTHPVYWLGGVAVVAVAALLIFGNVFGPSGKTFCTATLNQARDYGVISPSASLGSTSAKSTDVKNRKSCVAKVGDETYTLVADIKTTDVDHKPCRDYLKQATCVALYSVARSDGVTTYQVREIPPNDTDEALAKEGVLGLPPAPSPNAAPAGADAQAPQGGGLETDTAVDNSGNMQSAPPQGAPAPQGAPPQQ